MKSIVNMDLDFIDKCGNCLTSFRDAHSENEGVTKLKIKNNFCETVSEIQIWNALEFIYGVSWDWYQSYQLGKKVCLLSSQEDIKLCSNCASTLSECYNAHQNFENESHPSSPIEFLKEFRINRKNCPVIVPEESICNWPSKNLYESDNSELMVEDNTESDIKEDLFDTFAYEEAEDVISSQESIETKCEILPTLSIDNSISHKSLPNSLNELTCMSRKSTLRSRELVIKAEKLSPEEILQFTNNKIVTKRRSRKQSAIKNRKDVMKTRRTSKLSVTKFQDRATDVVEKMNPDVTKCKTGKKMSEAEFQERVAKALENVTDKTKCRKIVISGRFVCNVCGKSFTDYTNLKFRHWPIHNGTVKKQMCDICGKTVRDSTYLEQHKLRVHGTEEEKSKWRTNCDICDTVVYKFSLSSHIFMNHTKNPRDKYKCETCGAEYKNKHTYQCHILKHIEGPQQCDVCSKILPSSISLDNHKKQVHGQKKNACKKCPMKFVTKSELQRHEVIHEDVRKHVCDECGKTFKHTQHFRNHLKCHKDIQEKGEGAFTCDLCNDGKQFKHSLSLYKHKQRMHPSKRIAKKIHKCSFCGKRLCSQHNLRIHEKMHQELPGFKPRVRQKLPGHMLFIPSNGEVQS